MSGMPKYTQRAIFTTTGFASPDIIIPMPRSVNNWSMQVTGFNAAGKNVAATSWTVTLQGSNDGVGYDGDSQAILTHTGNSTNPDGSMVRTAAPVGPVQQVRIHCNALSLGSNATYIVVEVVGN